MKYNISEQYNAVVISFKGKLMGGPDAQDFQNHVSNFLEQGKKNIIIEMSDVKFADSSGIGSIIKAYTTVKGAGGQLKLAGLTDKIKGVLSIVKLDSIFEQYPTVDEAAKSF